MDDANVISALADALGESQVIVDEAAQAQWLTDWRGRYRGQALAVVFPQNTGEVAAAVRICAQAGVAMVPQGGNTGLCGGATPTGEQRSVVINLSHMKRVLAVDTANDTLTVEAGCTLATVQQVAADNGRLFPLSLASEGSCEVGGNLSTNAGGVQVLRYGNMRELVLGVEVVLSDGRIWDGLRALRKDNTGYDLKQLFIGAEGTLGIVTAMVLKLFPAPRARATAWVAVPGPAAAVALLRAVQGACGDRVTAFEIVGREALELVLRHIPDTRAPFGQVGEWAVLLELSDTGEGEALDALLEAALADGFETGLVEDAVIASSVAQARALWALRENISEAQRLEGVSIKHDIAVPVSRVGEFLERAGRALCERWPDTRIVAFGHIGDGNLHYNLSKADALANRDFIERTPEINRVVHDLVDALGGSISAEHGLGQLKREEITRYRSVVELEMMRALKRTFDPQGLMNPGKVV
ncbi:FAD-binding oxidoreductase [Pseudazoarcus pumilus]|uniref:Hydroxyacid dehydrogenase n=1 Tax=Pseudazoarcus pumilus TaxID=2067960 RepID=A0A2I6S7C3_9RHOO|nr:FAD-binding oxidoreductase [Pseudazoarcus pumilus]AUN95149.1 hydroxyacid dehydrogenase [Pseudazoarcus pumilus]